MEAGCYITILVLVLLQGTLAVKYQHEQLAVYLAQDGSPDKQFDWEVDRDELFYMDFNLKKEVARIPEFDPHRVQGGEARISANIAILKHNLNVWKNLSRGSQEPKCK
ncbi:hypothetical protein chiPu_0019893 [Chiloscyllium punctatum]|uniref:MHC class II alpha chain N-terminal domain-containing protein n=1 Tax=Chiloscyllium punctatum TaxID=137246 RepID=A0A401RTE3_CHIPU|nr:hypothetical protein [Chiloscyllium punctatum]